MSADEPALGLLGRISVDGHDVAHCRDGSDLSPGSSPRPYLHPLRTLGGTVVSDAHPADHDWHCGLSFAVQDANGANFWGGPSYRADDGYQWRGDQGVIRHHRWLEQRPDGWAEELRWTGPDVELTETRRMAWRRAGERGWVLDVDIELVSRLGDEVWLGGPGSHGRTGAGYGGLQLRLAANQQHRLWGPEAEGFTALHGSRSVWVAWCGDFGGRRVTVAMTAHRGGPTADRWFLRGVQEAGQGGWPGIGTALAWQEPVRLPVRRCHRLLLADGELTNVELAAALS